MSSETLITFILRKPLKQSKPGVKLMLVKFTSYPSDLRICVITTVRMYLACTRCKRGNNKALFISSLNQFLEEQLAKRLRGGRGGGTGGSKPLSSRTLLSRFPYLYLPPPALFHAAPVPCRLAESKHIPVI